ncbi:FHA domain-containing protein [Aphelenchoides bicaudatus]|nr:FHA domain-containing protein [Aphelenchoides bicaudatus]
MSVVSTPISSVHNNELAGNGPISIFSSPMNGRKSSNGSIESTDSDATIKNHIESSKPSSSNNENSPVSSSVQLNNIPASISSSINTLASISSASIAPAPIQPQSKANGIAKRAVSGFSKKDLPMAILTPCSNSHPFDERRIPVTRDEERAIKFGRAVARFQPAQNNAIFDCKVLSRNHAILWYENDQFFIKDTRSSNGTFVNNQRLSSSGEESAPRVLHSGDILQLGVDIIDHAKNVACGCTISIVRLIDERGEECVGSDETSLNERLPLNFMERLPTNCTLITHEKLFKLSQYMKEAQYREQLFTERLRNLESVLITTQEAAESGWQALINEERLLSRIESLENQITIYKSKAIQSGTDEFQEQVRQLIEDRNKVELAAKDSLKKAEDQIYEANMKVHDMERLLVMMDENNQSFSRRNTELEEENQRQTTDYDKLLQCYTEANKEIGGLKEALVAAKKTTSTFSVTRIEAADKKESSPDGKSEISSATCLNGTVPEHNERSAVFYQEAEAQTDAVAFNTEPAIESRLGGDFEMTKQTAGELGVRQTSTTRNLNGEAQFLLISMFPLFFLFCFLIIWPFKKLTGNTDETTHTSTSNIANGSTVGNLKKAE